MRTRSAAVTVTTLLAGMTLIGCTGQPASPLQLVAGGGDDPIASTASELALPGRAIDLDARDGVVALLLQDDSDRSVVVIEGDHITHLAVPDEMPSTRVALGTDGGVFVADADGLVALSAAGAEPVVATTDRPTDGNASDIPVEEGVIADLAVDETGALLWLSAIVAGEDPADAPTLTQVKRLENGSVSVVAGAGTASFDDEGFEQAEVSPPGGVAATEIPLRTMSRLASDHEGGVYLSGYRSILHVRADGEVEVVATDGTREAPSEPGADRADAAGFGGPWLENPLSAHGGIVVVQETNSGVSGDGFDWTGEWGDAQDLIDQINAQDVETLTLAIADGEAASVLGRAEAIALDGSTLYAAGTAHGSDGEESVVISTDLSDTLD